MAKIDDDYIDRGDDFEGYDEDEDQDELDDQEDDDQEDQDESDEEEDDTQDDEDSEEEEEEDVAPPKKEPRIPKSRFDEVIRQRGERDTRIEWLEQQLEKLISQPAKQAEVVVPEVPSYDFDSSEEEYISLIIAGEISKATKLRNEINTERQKEFKALISGIESKVSNQAKSESSLLLEKERFSTSIENMEIKYPFLNHKSKAYNEEAVDTVNTLLAGYIAAGKGKVESLQLAIKKVIPLYDKKSTTKEDATLKRKVDAGKKAVDAAKRQPGKTKSAKVGSQDVSTPISKMGEREFKKLTPKEKSILRGD